LDPPTPNDNLIYLLIELERAVKHANMVWSRELAISVQRKLVDLIQHLDPIT